MTVVSLSLLLVVFSLFAESSSGHAATSGLCIHELPVSWEWIAGRSVADTVNGSVTMLSCKTNDPFAQGPCSFEHLHRHDYRVSPGGAIVAVLDTGIDSSHAGLAGSIIAEVDFTGSQSADDVNGHGTHVTGIIGATPASENGITGIAPGCKILNVKVANDDGGCRSINVARGIIWAADHGAAIINVSLEIGKPSADLEGAINYAWRKGAVVVAAAGNDASSRPVYPAAYENCIAVSAVDFDASPAPMANRASWVDVVAPGVGILSTLPDGNYGFKSGTSPAAAYVSGLAVLAFDRVRDENGNGRRNDEVRAAIEAGCRKALQPGMGHGVIDASLMASGIRRPPLPDRGTPSP
jgi:thermitase